MSNGRSESASEKNSRISSFAKIKGVRVEHFTMICGIRCFTRSDCRLGNAPKNSRKCTDGFMINTRKEKYNFARSAVSATYHRGADRRSKNAPKKDPAAVQKKMSVTKIHYGKTNLAPILGISRKTLRRISTPNAIKSSQNRMFSLKKNA